MKKLRILSTVMIMALIFGALSITAQERAGTPTVSLEDVTVNAGEIASITVTLENNPGIIALRPQIKYKDTYFSVDSVVDGGVLAGKMHSNQKKISPYTLYWYDALATTDNYEDGTLATVLFNVPENTPGGTYDLTLLLQKKDAVKSSLREIGTSFELVHGSITVISDIVLGDVDDDGVVDDYDLELLESYFAGYDVTLDEVNADVDRDGNLNRRDLLLLSQYLLGEAEI